MYLSKKPKVEQNPIVSKEKRVSLLLLPLFTSKGFSLCLLFHRSCQTGIRMKVVVCTSQGLYSRQVKFSAGNNQCSSLQVTIGRKLQFITFCPRVGHSCRQQAHNNQWADLLGFLFGLKFMVVGQ